MPRILKATAIRGCWTHWQIRSSAFLTQIGAHPRQILCKWGPTPDFPQIFPLGGLLAKVYKPVFVARGRLAPRRDCFARGFACDAEALSIERRQVNAMANPFQFIQDVRSEAKKIVWPARRETMVTSTMVIVMVILASLFFVIVDSLLRFGVGLMLRIGQ